ncbi:MAG TPA: PfkB family carbohydrate kinase, partial [Dehalococcoidia bacterium]|nr:PfkB family carbohydrate kinase [Dehalococcoidia bacterium]
TDAVTGSAIRISRDRRLPIIVDPKGLHYGKYHWAGVVTPNAGEAARASHLEIRDEADLIEAGRRLLAELETEAILITRGEKGMSLFERGERVHHLPASAREVYDVTGAGDTVVATLTLALAAGADYRTAAELANRAAGVVVGKVGTASLTTDELERAVDGAI